ncbi:hypothetical protein EV182_003279, partial [Spiromyces aspiralis]
MNETLTPPGSNPKLNQYFGVAKSVARAATKPNSASPAFAQKQAYPLRESPHHYCQPIDRNPKVSEEERRASSPRLVKLDNAPEETTTDPEKDSAIGLATSPCDKEGERCSTRSLCASPTLNHNHSVGELLLGGDNLSTKRKAPSALARSKSKPPANDAEQQQREVSPSNSDQSVAHLKALVLEGLRTVPFELYDLRRFKNIVCSILDTEPHVLSSHDFEVLAHYEDLSFPAQCLFVRLMLRKYGWFQANKIAYEEVPDVCGTFRELCHHPSGLEFPLAESNSELAEVDADMLSFLDLAQLKKLGARLGLKQMSKCKASIQECEYPAVLPKQELVAMIASHCEALNGKLADPKPANIVLELTGSLLRIHPQAVALVERLMMVYYRWSHIPQEGYMQKARLIEMEVIAYPSYQVSRSPLVFRSHDEATEYYNLLKDWDTAAHIPTSGVKCVETFEAGIELYQKHRDRW